MFDLSKYIREFAVQVSAAVPDFRHIQHDQVIYGLSRAAKKSPHGVYAKTHPLRFENGEIQKIVHGHLYRCSNFVFQGKKILYYISFLLPRFMDLTQKSKMITILHELFHIAPEFNGDIRRLTDGKPAHGASREAFDKNLEPYYDEIIAHLPKSSYAHFDGTYEQMIRQHGGITGVSCRITGPRLVTSNDG